MKAWGAHGLLPRYAGFGAALAFAGPPIYIHAPSLFATEHGLGLAAIGALLLGLRALDFAQDPLIGWWLGRTDIARRYIAAAFALLLGLGAVILFWPETSTAPSVRLAVGLAIVFTGFSALQVLFYASGVAIAEQEGIGHGHIAAWREAGVLAGVCAACILPELLKPFVGDLLAYGLFALAFCVALAFAVKAMAAHWPARRDLMGHSPSFAACWRDPVLRRLLIIGLLNALPTGLTATLFLFFVQDLLMAPIHAGPALIAFFLAAAAAAPLWARAANNFGAKQTLLVAMGAAILIFACALTLGAGDWPAFYLVAIGSGVAMGADLTLLPAMVSGRLAALGQGGEVTFGLWGFVNKAGLALAAGLALPVLDLAGFAPGIANSASALAVLSAAYAGIPCLLKLIALAALALTPNPEPEVVR